MTPAGHRGLDLVTVIEGPERGPLVRESLSLNGGASQHPDSGYILQRSGLHLRRANHTIRRGRSLARALMQYCLSSMVNQIGVPASG